MTEGQVSDDGDTKVADAIAQHLFYCQAKTIGGRLALTKASERNTADLLELAAESPLRQHAIESIGDFTNLFQCQNRPAQDRLVSGVEVA